MYYVKHINLRKTKRVIENFLCVFIKHRLSWKEKKYQ